MKRKRAEIFIGVLAGLWVCSANAWAISVYPAAGQTVNSFNTGPGLFTGVAWLQMDGFGACSGSLLWTGAHVLTAAHCLETMRDPSHVHATFTYAGGTLTASGADIFIPDEWISGDLENGWDWAILTLATTVTNPLIERYNINQNPASDLGLIDVVGFGRGGTGATGETSGSGTRRWGQNEAEGSLPGAGLGGNATLLFDFDGAGLNTLPLAYGINSSSGLGPGEEVSLTRGDSGGPSFRNGKIVGIHSGVALYGATMGMYGDISLDTRVSSYAVMIDDLLAPEPGSVGLVGVGLLTMLLVLKRARRQSTV
jgi:hypothetical protein